MRKLKLIFFFFIIIEMHTAHFDTSNSFSQKRNFQLGGIFIFIYKKEVLSFDQAPMERLNHGPWAERYWDPKYEARLKGKVEPGPNGPQKKSILSSP